MESLLIAAFSILGAFLIAGVRTKLSDDKATQSSVKMLAINLLAIRREFAARWEALERASDSERDGVKAYFFGTLELVPSVNRAQFESDLSASQGLSHQLLESLNECAMAIGKAIRRHSAARDKLEYNDDWFIGFEGYRRACLEAMECIDEALRDLARKAPKDTRTAIAKEVPEVK